MPLKYLNFALLSGLLLACQGVSGSGSLYQWIDLAGQTNYSDRPPPGDSSDVQRSQLPPARNATPAGLRAAERRLLRASEQRRRQRQDAATVRSAKARREQADRREACRAALDNMHSTRLHEQRKQRSEFLRRHCW